MPFFTAINNKTPIQAINRLLVMKNNNTSHPFFKTLFQRGSLCALKFTFLIAVVSFCSNNVTAQNRPSQQQQQPDKQQPNRQLPQGLDAGLQSGTPTVKADANQTIQGALKDQKAKRQAKAKDPNKASWLGMRFQDLSARFNRYFNAKLRYDEGITRLKQDHKDNYDNILPVYVYNSGSGTSITSNLDDAIKKASLAIQLKPNSKWIDDCYQLVGQSYYLKGDNDAAISSFQYVTKNFSLFNRRFPNKQQRALDKKQEEKMRQDREMERELALKERKEQANQKKKESEQKKKELAKEREDKKKEIEAARKEKQKEQQEASKARKKEIEAKKAEQAKTQKEKLKEIERKKKEREKEQKELKRQKQKALEAKKKGKPVPPPSAKSSSKEEKKPEATATEKDTEVKSEDKETVSQQEEQKKDEVKPPAPTKEEKGKKKEKSAKQEAETQDKTESGDTTSVSTNDNNNIALDNMGKPIDASEKAKGGAGGGFKLHKLSKYDAMIWLARTYIEKKQFTDAEQVIKIAKDDRKFPKKKLDDLAVLEAHYFLTRQDWSQASTALKNAIKVSKSKKEKARLYFILAQISNENKNYADALTAFNKVLKSRPSFDMEFNTRLNIAQTKLRSGAFTQEQAVAYLERMTKENKYADVSDQIFFAMAEIAIEKGDMTKATAYLGESAKNSTANKDQKAQSFLKLADLNYDLERYVTASAYYDSTLTLLAKSYPSYSDISNRRSVLTELVEYINTIALQDSLQRIAKMPEGARRAYLEEAITKMEEEAARKREAEALKEAAAMEAANTPAATETGTWYFYNPITRSNGEVEFNRRWGARPLADNWRLGSKTMGVIVSSSGSDSNSNNANDLMSLASEGKLKVEDLLKNLPLKPEDLSKSDTLIADALFGLGMAYRNRLNNIEKATVTFDDLLRRYPVSQYSAQVHYTQYLMAKEANNTQKANQHKNQLLQNYPETTFAKLVEDPGHLQAVNEKGRQLEQYYEQTYAYYKQNNFDEVRRRSEEVNNLFALNPLQPKFDLLNALIVGHSQDKAAYITALREVILKHPTDEVKTKAQEILGYLEGNAGNSATASVSKPASAGNYTYQENARQYVAVSFTGYSQQISGLTNKLSDFNNSNFSVDKLKVNQMLLDPQTQVVLIKEFNDAGKAMTYYRALQQNESTVFQGLDVAFKFFVISKPNFTEYFKNKDTNAYYDFFIQNYK